MSGYNKLTQRLIAEGYTAEDHPDYVYVADKTLDNYKGGFEYYRWVAYEKTYKTPCGLLCKGNFAHTGLSWFGVDWTYENDNPWILCPKGETDCILRDEPFRSQGNGVLCRHCVVHETDEDYNYGRSCEGEKHLLDDKIRRQKLSFALQRNNRICDNHMHYDIHKKEWTFYYDPMNCANGFCRAQTTDMADGGFCPVLNRGISRDKGNVYYDVRYSGRDYSKDGTFFEGERFERVVKGKQLFEKPIRFDIAKLIALNCRDEIRSQARWNNRDFDSLTFFRAELGELDFQWEVINIRAEKRYVRNLEQDLEDIANGITISHEYDIRKTAKDNKRKNRIRSKQKMIDRIEKLILREGYDNLEWVDQNRANKLLDPEKIDDLNAQYYDNQQRDEPMQLSFEDYLNSTEGC